MHVQHLLIAARRIRSATGETFDIAKVVLGPSLRAGSACAEGCAHVFRAGQVFCSATSIVFDLFQFPLMGGGFAVFAEVTPGNYYTHDSFIISFVSAGSSDR